MVVTEELYTGDILKTAGIRAKRAKIWDSRSYGLHMDGSFLVGFHELGLG